MAQKFLTDIEVTRGLVDSSGDLGVAGQVLSSTGSGTNWITNEANSTVVYLDEFTGDNSTVDFTLSVSVTDENITQVYIDGVYQNKDTYSVSGTTLTFSTAPPLNADIEVITFSTATTSDNLAAGSVVIPVKNTHTASIAKGEPVYITGNVGASARLQIAPADASNSAKMPSAGLLLQTLAVNEEGYVITGGYLRNITTDVIDGTSTSSNNTVYVKAGGGLTMTKPTGTNLIQNVAKVARSSGGNSGSLLVSSILRTNDVPNITNDYFWLGNSSGVATPTEFTSTARGLLSIGAEGTAAGDGDLAYNNSSGVFTYTPPVLGGLSGTTDNITEGSTNLYYTDARSRSSISAGGDLSYNSTTGVMSYTTPTTIASLSNHDTDDLSEGASNLYYTDARSRSAISVSGNAISYNSSTGVITSNYEENPTFTGNVTISGNLTVDGTQTILNTQTVEVEDNILQLNTTQGSPDTATATTSGISVYRGDGVTQASFIFDDADDTWDLTNNLVVDGNASFVGNLAINTNKFTVNATTGDSVIAGNLNFPDDKRIRLGTSNAFQIYYDTTAAAGQGGGIITGIRTYIESTFFQVGSSTKTAIAVDVNNYVILYQNNNEKLRTIGTGVDITGAINADSANISGSVTITGGTTDGLNITTSGTQDTIKIDRAATSDNAMTKYQTGSVDKWIVGLRNTGDDNFRFYSYGTSSDVLTINQADGNVTFGGNVTLSDDLVIENGNSTYSVPAPANTNVPLIYLRNTNNTASTTTAHSIITLRTQINGGDPFISFDVENETGWTAGMDNSDNNFKITTGWNDVGSGTGMAITTTGNATFAGSGTFTSDSTTARVLYLEAGGSNGNIIQFQKSSVNKWELVGRDGTFYIYKNDGTGSGYKWQIDSNGNHTITGDATITTSMRTPIFYDLDDTNYYLNPAGAANLYNLELIGSKNTYLYINPGNGYEAMVRFNGGSGSTWYVGSRMTTQLIGSTDAHHIYSQTAGRTIGGYDTAGNHYAYGSSRAPIFYDSNNTAYFYHGDSGASLAGTMNIHGGTGGNYGNQLIVGQSSIALPYTLQDTNIRPVIAATGQYPVLHLNHTVTSNGSHGPTIQYSHNGSGARQWVHGSSGDGEHFFFGYSDSSQGNTDYNPHNGIAGYAGTSMMTFKNNGYVGIGGDWGALGGGDPGYAIDTRGTLYNDTDVRAPIFYDSNNTAYVLDPNNSNNSAIIAGSVNCQNYNKAGLLLNASGTGSSGAAFGMQQVTSEGWTGIFVDFEPNTGWGLYHDNPNNYFCVTSEASTNNMRSFTVPSRSSGNRTAYEKIRFEQSTGHIFAGGDMYANTFYERTNTNYFIDPSLNSTIYNLQLGRSGNTPKFDMLFNDHASGPGWDTRIFIGRSDDHPNGTSFPTYTPTGGYGIQFQANSDGVFYGMKEYSSGNYRPFINWGDDSGDTPMEIAFNGTTQFTLSYDGINYATSSHRAPIFYDSNDTNYYVDPASTSTMYVVNTSAYSNANGGFQVFRNTGTTAPSWPTSDHTFSLENSDAGYLSINFHRGGYTSNNIWYTGSEIIVDTTYRSTSSLRAPIFYDSNNTTYYTRPSTYSYMNQIWTTGVIQAGSSGTGDIYLGNNGISGSGNHFRFHTASGATYFDMNSGTINWREGSSTRYYFYPSTASITINGTLTQYSDIRCKENIVEIPDAIDKIKSIRGVYYNRTDFNTEPTKIGVIAQEVEVLMPELILQAEDTDMKSVSYNELTAVLVQAIKEQQTIIDDLKASIETLKNQINGIN